MSQADIFPTETTTLYTPAWYSDTVREERELPLAPGDYKVTPGERWIITSLKNSSTVYSGIGPVEIRRASAAASGRSRSDARLQQVDLPPRSAPCRP